MRIRTILWAVLPCIAILGLVPSAFAHTSESGYILLLPTEYYLLGGTLSVALSFLILSLTAPKAVVAGYQGHLSLPWIPAGVFDTVLSAVGFFLFAGSLYCGV